MLKKINAFNNKELESNLKVWLEVSESGEPALTNGKVWLMTWRADKFTGFYNIEKDGSTGDLFYQNMRTQWFVETEFNNMKKNLKEYKEEKHELDTTSKESLEKFIDFYCGFETRFMNFINPMLNTISLICVKLRLIKSEDIIEFQESEVIREYFIRYIEYNIANHHSSFNYSFPHLVGIIMNKMYWNEIDYTKFLKPLNSPLYNG